MKKIAKGGKKRRERHPVESHESHLKIMSFDKLDKNKHFKSKQRVRIQSTFPFVCSMICQ